MAELTVAAHLVRLGATVLTPLSQHGPFDLAVLHDGVMWRVQVKHVRMSADGTVRVRLYTSYRGGYRGYDGDADVVAAYCPDTGDIYATRVSRTKVLKLRTYPGAPLRGARYAADFTLRDLRLFSRGEHACDVAGRAGQLIPVGADVVLAGDLAAGAVPHEAL